MAEKNVLKKLLGSKRRKEMWKHTQRIMAVLEKDVEVSSSYLIGSFTTKKRRPADVDLVVLIQSKEKNPKADWSVDLQISPDNKYGDKLLEDAKKWMKQKYGAKKSAVIRLK